MTEVCITIFNMETPSPHSSRAIAGGHSGQLHPIYKPAATDHRKSVPCVCGQPTDRNVIGELPVGKPGFLPSVQCLGLALHNRRFRVLPCVQCR